MSGPVFSADALAAFAGAYPNQPVRLTHSLLEHPLLTLDALADLAAALPADSIEYNPGKLPIGIAPEDVPGATRSAVETIRAIADAESWVSLKRIEQVPAYAELLHAILDELKGVVGPVTGAMHRCEGFVFITSPGCVTPFHFDPEHNILLQVRGAKTMTVFPVDDEAIFAPLVHEQFHLGAHHRNLVWQDDFAARGTAVALAPGQALHVPVKVPHWVQNGDAVSVSLSVTWRSEWTVAEADARAFNHVLRRAGLNPASPQAFPARNTVKAASYRAIRRVRQVLAGRSPAGSQHG